MNNEFFKEIDYQLLDERVVYKGKRITVEELHYFNPRHNERIYREHVIANDAVMIMPIAEDNELIMIKEPRTPIGKTVLSFPAGMIEPGETDEEGAIRELEEETGYKAQYIKKLRDIYPEIGYSNEKISIFLAKDFIKTQTNFDETEDIEVVKVPLEKAKEMLDNNEFETNCEVIALLHFFAYEYSNTEKAKIEK